MAKNKEKNKSEPKPKKGPDITAQKVKKAKNALKSGGRRGLEQFLSKHPDIKGHREVAILLKRASGLPERLPKGLRGPKDPNSKGGKRQKGQSSFGSIKALREAYKADPEGTYQKVQAEAAEAGV